MEENALKVYTTKARADKSINILKGILEGITFDGVINDLEVEELKQWSTNQKDLINKNPFKEIMSTIESVTFDGDDVSDILQDIYWMCERYESEDFFYGKVTADLQLLQGICHGVLSDGIINDEEIYDLHEWLENNEHLNTYFPYDELRSLVLSIISDKKITNDERLILKAYISQFVIITNSDVSDKIVKEIEDVRISGLCSSTPNIDFLGKTFCITGVLKSESRSSLKNKLLKLGAVVSDSVTKQTDYLIVGDNGNPAWAFSCYGRKVEKALGLRKEGVNISLIHEFDLYDELLDKLVE